MRTTYRAVARKSGEWRAVEITSGLPEGTLGVSQARSLTEVDGAARSLIADLLEINPDEIALDIGVEAPEPVG